MAGQCRDNNGTNGLFMQDKILTFFALNEHKHGSIYAEAFHFLRGFTVIDTVSQESLSKQGYHSP